jgi:ABC-type phosphate transport system substrate-binding protein
MLDSNRTPATSPRRRAALALLLALAAPADAGVVVIGNGALAKLDAPTLRKVFTGKLIELGGIGVVAVNASPGSAVRDRFLQTYMEQDEEKYTAYWTVRRYVGKGSPPRELATSADVIHFVQSTPGAIGYVDETDLKPGLNVLLRK